MPCGQPCKEVIDKMAALVQSLECAKTSILLNVANAGDGPPADLVAELVASMEEAAGLAQKLSHNTPAGG
jgi:hypothetical protein